MNKQYWEKFYKKNKKMKQSSFAEYVLPMIKGRLFDLGCGNGRDTYFFLKKGIEVIGIDDSFNGERIVKCSISDFIKEIPSVENVYTRFVWHAINRKDQLKILKWTKKFLFIEARTIEDKPKIYKNHKRNLVNVTQLVSDLKKNSFQIIALEEGRGYSKFKNEDPFLVRIIAIKIKKQ